MARHAVAQCAEFGTERRESLVWKRGEQLPVDQREPERRADGRRADAQHEIAEIVGEFAVEHFDEPLLAVRDVSVAARGAVVQQVVAQWIGAEALDERERVDVSGRPRLADLPAAHQPVAVAQDLLRLLEPGPNYRVEAQDVLPDHLHCRRPQRLELGQRTVLALL